MADFVMLLCLFVNIVCHALTFRFVSKKHNYPYYPPRSHILPLYVQSTTRCTVIPRFSPVDRWLRYLHPNGIASNLHCEPKTWSPRPSTRPVWLAGSAPGIPRVPAANLFVRLSLFFVYMIHNSSARYPCSEFSFSFLILSCKSGLATYLSPSQAGG